MRAGFLLSVGIGNFNPEDLLVVVTSLDVTRDDALTAECLTRLSIKEFEALVMKIT